MQKTRPMMAVISGLVVLNTTICMEENSAADSPSQVTSQFENQTKASVKANQVVFLYNSQNSFSAAAHEAYLEARPTVRSFDINLPYSDTTDWTDEDWESPPPGAVTNFYITPQAYLDHIRQPLLAYIETAPVEILGFVTSRGLPALVSENFQPTGSFHGQSDGVWSSLEGALMKLSINGTKQQFQNPYSKSRGIPVATIRNRACSKPIYFASRLDATWGPNGEAKIDMVRALITRSLDLEVNKLQVTTVVDGPGAECGWPYDAMVNAGADAAQLMYESNWYVYQDQTVAFLHGAKLSGLTWNDCSCTSSSIEDCPRISTEELAYIDYPELIHFGLGRNSLVLCCEEQSGNQCLGVECVDRAYVEDYIAHDAGLFISLESYNGRQMRGAGTSGHGDVLDWISRAGGSFTYGYVNGGVNLAKLPYMADNLYNHGLTWGEASLSGIGILGSEGAPVGDPLARVRVLSPDVNHDQSVDEVDFALVIAHIGRDPSQIVFIDPDVDGNGVIDMTDAKIVRSNTDSRVRNPIAGTNANLPSHDPAECFLTDPNAPADLPNGYVCRGDVNHDEQINKEDYAWVQEYIGCNCPRFDVTQDGVVDQSDLNAIRSNMGPLSVVADVNTDGVVTCSDLWIVQDNIGCDPCSGDFDFECDGVVDLDDTWFVFDFAGLGIDGLINGTVAIDLNGDGVDFECGDLAIIRENFCDIPGECDPAFDVNADGVVNCTDELSYQMVFRHALDGELDNCPGYGCGHCPE